MPPISVLHAWRMPASKPGMVAALATLESKSANSCLNCTPDSKSFNEDVSWPQNHGFVKVACLCICIDKCRRHRYDN